MRIGILTAMDSEYSLACPLMERSVTENLPPFKDIEKASGSRCLDRTEDTFSFSGRGHDIIVRKSGIGKVNAALSAYRLITEDKVSLVINSGCAGGLSSDLKIGDAVIGTCYAYHDVWCGPGNERGQVQGLPPFFEAPLDLIVRLEEKFASKGGVHFGEICTGDAFIESTEDDARVLSVRPNALACDMEAAAIAQTCFLSGVPFLAYKVISDVHCYGADRSWTLYDDFWGRLAHSSFSLLSAIIDNIRG